jgi:hypothetical protein
LPVISASPVAHVADISVMFRRLQLTVGVFMQHECNMDRQAIAFITA